MFLTSNDFHEGEAKKRQKAEISASLFNAWPVSTQINQLSNNFKWLQDRNALSEGGRTRLKRPASNLDAEDEGVHVTKKRLAQDFAARNIILPPPHNVSHAAGWKEFAKDFAQPCHDYFFSTVMGDKNIKMYKAILLTNPDFFHQDQSLKTEQDLATSTRKYLKPLVEEYHLINAATVDNLISELSKYMLVVVLVKISILLVCLFQSFSNLSQLSGTSTRPLYLLGMILLPYVCCCSHRLHP